MLRLLPLPDEIACAYKGRLLQHNGWSDPNEGMRWLLAWAGSGGANRREVSTVELLAKVAGMDTTTFVMEHTTVPLRRSVVGKPPCFPHGNLDQGSLLWTMALRDIRAGAYFCMECVEEDFDYHGTPYWRREAQLPGVYWCSKHGIVLSYVENANAFLSSPTAFIENHQVVSQRWVADLQKSEPVKRFLAISADLLARTQPLDERDVSKVARTRAMALDLHTGRGIVRKRLLSDLVKQLFDNAWLACVVPGLIDKQAGEYWQPVDGAVSGKRACVGSIVYALAFSVIFESADDAINAMIGSSSADKCMATQHLKVKKVDEEQLRSAYVAAHGSHRAAAAQLNVGQSTTRNRLDALGLPALGNLDAVRLSDAILALLQNDMPLSRACKENGLALTDVKAALSNALGPLDTALGQITGIRSRQKSVPRFRSASPPSLKTTRDSARKTGSPAMEAFWSRQRVAEEARPPYPEQVMSG